MPVLSPRHSSSLSGSYRSTFSSSLTSRPYYGSSTYSSPRISTTSYSERYSTKTYSTDEGKKLYARHASITEDGITTRYREREETREKSLRRDSLNRDSGFNGSARSSSLRDTSIGDRELSLTRDSRNYSSTLSMIDSVADLRNKYSPSNYVPAVLRGKDIERSKSINDIGRPPVTAASNEKTQKTAKKVTKIHETITSKTSVAFTNNTNKEKLDNLVQIDDDTNGNRTSSVAEIRKKFDPNPCFVTRKCTLQNGHASDGNKTTKNTKTKEKECVVNHEVNVTPTHKPELLGGNIKCYNKQQQQQQPQQQKLKINTDAHQEQLENKCEAVPDGPNVEEKEEKCAENEMPRPHNHTTNFASYIPNKEFFETQKTDENSEQIDNNDAQNRITTANNDITTSPRLPRSSISQSSSISTANNRSSPSNNRASPPSAANNRASPSAAAASTLDTIRARSLAANAIATNSDEDGIGGGAGGRFDRDRGGSVRSQGLNGLKNIGNTCFMNSVIQCLSNTKYLLEYVREDGYQSDINTSISSMKGALIKAFSQVIQELWSPDSSDKVVNTVALKSQIQRFAPRFMGYAQQDAQEFLRYLLEGLHEDVNRVTSKPKPILTEIDETLSDSQKASEAWSRYLRMDNSRVVDIFVGQLKSTLRCTHCGHCSVTFDPFWDLSLPIPQRQGPLRLGQCLEHFTREETLDGDEKPTCSKCKERRKCTKSFCIQKFPKILVIHLKRFSPTERFRGKLSLVIDFPLQGLDLSAFAASKSQTESMYNLYAISNHSGTTYSGHYTAYCKHPYSGQWHEYNDSRVSSISSKNVVSSEAYVLFYELINQNSHL